MSSVVPPAVEIGRRVLSACEQEGKNVLDEEEPLQQELLKAWSEMHYLRTPSHAGPLVPLSGEEKSLATVTLCQRVGFCCCGPAMAQRRRFRSTLSSLLKIFFKKGAAGRKLYDRALAVLHVFSDRSDSACYVVGFGNLTDSDFTVKPMKQVRKGFDPFCFEGVGGATDLWAVGASLDLDKPYTAEIMSLDVDRNVVIEDFKPLAFLAVVIPLIGNRFWPPPLTSESNKKPTRQPSGHQPQVLAPPSQPSIEDGGDDEEQGEVLPDADEALVEAAGWQLSSDSGEDVAHDHQEGQPPRRGVSSRTLAGLSSVVHGARPPYVPGSLRIPRPPPQADDAAAAVPRHRAPFIPRRVRSAWPKIEHSETATGRTNYLRMSVTAAKHHADLLAVCRYHGERCARSRSMMKERDLLEATPGVCS